MMRLRLLLLVAVLFLVNLTPAQPVPVPGTPEIPNEYGSTFPQEITWGSDGARMVLIPYGTFTMGTNLGTPSEGPVREIYVSSFYIDKYEVTNEQYDKATRLVPSLARPNPTLNKELTSDKLPVIAIPWTSAEDYAEASGKVLPSEAMWEKAARGPKGSLYSTGDDSPSPEVVIHNRGAAGITAPAQEDTGDVSSYGVFHMGGNAAEFVSDWYSRDFYKEDGNTKDPVGPATGETRVFRGASFLSRTAELRATQRNAIAPTVIRDEVGFRTAWIPRPVSKVVTPTPAPTPKSVTTDDLISKMIDAVIPHMKAGDPRLPVELIAGKSYRSGNSSSVQFVNFSPFRMTLTFFNPTLQLVYVYNEPVSEMSYRNVVLPTDVDLHVVAWAPDAPAGRPVRLGMLRSESKPIIVIPTEFFIPLSTVTGERIEVKENAIPSQYYDSFEPLWNEMEVYNSLQEPLIVRLHDIAPNTKDLTMLGEYTVAAKEALRITLSPGRYQFSASYFGATGDSGKPTEVRMNEKAQRRAIILKEDSNQSPSVTVITEKRRPLLLDLREAVSIPR